MDEILAIQEFIKMDDRLKDFKLDYENGMVLLRKQEEALVKQVLQDYLQRDPTIEDLKKTRVFSRRNMEVYHLCYDKKCLGAITSVHESTPTKYKIMYKFSPAPWLR